MADPVTSKVIQKTCIDFFGSLTGSLFSSLNNDLGVKLYRHSGLDSGLHFRHVKGPRCLSEIPFHPVQAPEKTVMQKVDGPSSALLLFET